MDTKQRPWEGTALGVIDIIITVFSILGALAFFLLQGFFSGLSDQYMPGEGVHFMAMLKVMFSFGLVIGIFLICVAVLSIFLARGSFKGQKWTVIVNLIFAILGVIGGLNTLGMMNSTMLGNLAVNAFALYCSVMCLKSPYYK